MEGRRLEKFDVIICGAGPAGATLARVAKKSLRILLLDGAPEGGKPCGGLLAPDAQKALARFDLALPKDVLVDPQIFSVRTIDLKNGAQRWYPRMYINVSRQKFDSWLLSLIPPNVSLEKATLLRAQKVPFEGFEAAYRTLGGEIRTARAPILVGADGAHSRVRETFFPPLRTRRYVAIQQWFKIRAGHPLPFYSCVFDPETSDCCSWSIFKDGYLIFGGAFAPKNCRANFEKQKKRLSDFGLRFGQPVRTEACQVLRPTSLKSFCCGGKGVFLIGEAAGFISPSSLEGISWAIKSAVALSESLAFGKSALKAYRRKTLSLRLRLCAKNLKCPFMYWPRLRALVMKSGISSIDVYGK